MVFQCINIRQVPWEVLKTAAFGLGFQHLPRDLANVNAWKNMFDPYIVYAPLKRCPGKTIIIIICFLIKLVAYEIFLSDTLHALYWEFSHTQ